MPTTHPIKDDSVYLNHLKWVYIVYTNDKHNDHILWKTELTTTIDICVVTLTYN